MYPQHINSLPLILLLKARNTGYYCRNFGWRQEIPTESTALTAFDLTHGVGAENFDIKLLNKALESIRIIGGEGFISQEFNFTGYNNLRELYLVGTLDSRVTLENCENLEIFATSRSVYKPQTLKGPSGLTVASTPEANGYYKVEGPVAEWANESISIPEGIGKAEPTYLLSRSEDRELRSEIVAI